MAALRLGDRLVEAGLVTATAVEQALQHQRMTGLRLGECLRDLGLISEDKLLEFLAGEFKTRFYSTEKLSKARVTNEILDLVPARMAEANAFLPVAVDPTRKVVSVVMAEPQNVELAKEIATRSEMNEVFIYVGLRSSILAAVRKFYYGDAHAFAELEKSSERSSDTLRLVSAFEAGGPRVVFPDTSARQLDTPRAAANQAHTPSLKDALYSETRNRSAVDAALLAAALVDLSEARTQNFAGHSRRVAALASRVGRRLGMSPKEVQALAVSATVHEVGAPADNHVTLVAVAQGGAEAKATARKRLAATTAALASAQLPPGVQTAVSQRFEAFDGRGLPGGLKGSEIALSARIIAAVDALDDLAFVSSEPGQGATTLAALATLRTWAGSLFDPRVLLALEHVASKSVINLKLETDGRAVWVACPGADGDALCAAIEAAAVPLERCHDLLGFADAVAGRSCDVACVSLLYGVADVATFVEYVRGKSETTAIPVVVVGEPTEKASRERLLAAGVTAFIPVPLDTTRAAAVLLGLLKERAEHGAPGRAIEGTFDVAPAADVLKSLGRQKSWGRLTFRVPKGKGVLDVEGGTAIRCTLGASSGSAALADLRAQVSGSFEWNPESLWIGTPTIDVPLDSLT